MVITVCDDAEKTTESAGTPTGTQLAAVFHSPEAGVVLQIELLIGYDFYLSFVTR
jgi:H+/Cl- antiporter ClcA